MISFVNFARIASICVGFDLGTLHGYFFSSRLLAKFEFPARISNKTCLNINPTFCLMNKGYLKVHSRKVLCICAWTSVIYV